MELAYLFIKGRVKATAPGFEDIENAPYKVFQNASFCFSNKFDISYNDQTGLISITENSEFVSNFFDVAGKINSVTSIVGINGTGKSSILEFIKSVTDRDFNDFPYKFLAIFRLSKESTISSSNDFQIIFHDTLKYNSESEKGLPRNCAISKATPLSKLTDYGERTPPMRILYLSNILEVFILNRL